VAYELVAIGTSWGGLHALSTLLGGLPAAWALPVVVVQHRARDTESLLGELLQARCRLPVREAEDKQPLAGGCVLLAPADYHLLVARGHCELSTDPLVRFSRPSIDVTMESVADSYGPRAIGIVLTGANEDGAAGLARIAARGGHAIVQDPATAEVRIMPDAARRAVPSAQVLPLEEIAPALLRLTAAPGAAPGGAMGAEADAAGARRRP
jgi:two-component system chemotaxis response regulator CheB